MPRPKCFAHKLRVFVHCQEDKLCFGHGVFQMSGGVQPIHLWHGNVQNNDF